MSRRYEVTRWTEIVVEDEPNPEPRYVLAAVAARSGVHVRTIRRYEDYGLLAPSVARGARLYSEADVARVQRIRRLTDDLGMNLAGVAAVLHLRDQLIALQREMVALRDREAGS